MSFWLSYLKSHNRASFESGLRRKPLFRRALKHREGRLGDTWHVDEVFATIRGQIHYLWRTVDQDGDILDILVQRRRDAATPGPAR